MFVRTIYAVGDPAKVDTVIKELSGEFRSLTAQQPGFRGMGVFCDRDLGKVLTGSWWEGEQAMRDADEALGQRCAELFHRFEAGTAIDRYEVVASARPREMAAGACMRLTRLEFDPMDADLVAETMRGFALDRLTAIPGVMGVAMFMDRPSGRATASVLYEDRAALARSRTAQAAVREEATGKAHLTVRGVEEFDVVFAGGGPQESPEGA